MDRTNLEAFAEDSYEDDKLNFDKMTIPVFDRVENIVGKGENAGYQHLLLFPFLFSKYFFRFCEKLRLVW